MRNSIKVNGNTYLPLDTIRSARPLSGDEQDNISKRYDIDAKKFNSQLTLTNSGKPILTQETCDELSAMGLALVNIGNDKRIPADNIIAARDLSKADKENLEAKGFTLSKTFRSTVETSTGLVLSTAYPTQVLDRRAKALDILAAQDAANDAQPSQDAPEAAKG